MPELSPELQQSLIDKGVHAAGAILLLIVVWILAGWARRITARVLGKAEFDETLTLFFSKMVRWLIILLGTLTALTLFGIEMTSFAAILGGAGVAVGLALSGLLGNFASGIMLLLFRPFKVGDVVSAAGVTAKVSAIELFTTTMDTPDNRRFIVPNNQIFGSTIENISFHEVRRADVAVGTDYSADLDKTREVLERVARELPGRIQDKDPQVYLVELGASSIDWSVRIWVDAAEFWPLKEQATRAIKVALDEAGIGIPFPQMDVHLDPPVSGAA